MKKVLFTIFTVTVAVLCLACSKEENGDVSSIENDHAPNETLLVENTPNAGVEFEVSESDGKITINAYVGNGINVIIPETINEKEVVAIGKKAFADNLMLEQIYIGEKIESIDPTAFDGSENVIIVTKAGSVAHNFAAQNQIKYNLY